MAATERGSNEVKVGNLQDIKGEVIIAGGDIYKGLSAEQVSALLEQIAGTFQPKNFDGRCPYKGLDPFEEEDAEFFYGRERIVADLVGRVNESRTVFITGPSGSGKSSLARAGLIPALRAGAIAQNHSDQWLYASMRPARNAFESLALAFSRLKSPQLADYFRQHVGADGLLNECAESVLSERKDQRLVVFVDQFEEVFTQLSRDQTQAFSHLLASAATVEDSRVIILFALRSDFVPNCALFPELNELLNRQFVQIGAMQPNELVSAIAQPALRVGLRIDPDLIAQIINDMQGEPGALPLMQFALKDLFDAEQARSGVVALTREAYLQRGGIHKSLELHADDAFSKLSETEQELARYVFGGLIEIGRGTQDTRRTALFDELIPANTEARDVAAIVQRLADARLITTDEQGGKETVTISHEKLIDAWPWLKKLVNENRNAIAAQNEITNDAKEWDEHKRDASYLYRGGRLALARENMKFLALSELAVTFIDTGFEAEEYARRMRERQRNWIFAGLAIIAIIMAGLGLWGQINAAEAQNQARISRAGELAAQSEELRDRNFALGSLLGIKAYQTLDTVQTRGAVLDNAEAHPQFLQYLSRHTGPVTSVAFSPDGKTFASGGEDRSIILWDVATHQPIGQPLRGHANAVTSVAFSPDGKLLASSSTDRTLILWDVATGQAIGRPLTGHISFVNSVAFSPDGKTLASGSTDKTIILWDVATHQPIGQPLIGHAEVVKTVAFSPDGRTLASGSWDGTIILWDVATHHRIGQALKGHTDVVQSVAFSPDGKTLASSGDDSTVILWDVATGKPIGQPLTGHTNAVRSVAFSPDGKTLESGSPDKTIIVWDMVTRRPIGQSLTGLTDVVTSMAFGPDGHTLVCGTRDGAIALWDMAAHPPIGQLLKGHADAVTSVAFSPDGKTIASGSDDRTLILWNVATGQPIGQPLRRDSGIVDSVAFSPDGKTLASGSDNRTISVWDVATRQPIGPPLIGHADSIDSVAFSPDGKTLASGSWDGTIILWDVAARQPIGPPLVGHTGIVRTVAFSPDGRTLASGSADTTIILWDLATHQRIGQPLTVPNNVILSLAFSPDGRRLASGTQAGTIILWDVATRQVIAPPLTGHTDIVYSVAFSPDGRTLASGSADTTIILWDVATHQPIGQPLIGHTSAIRSVAFSPDGKRLASGSLDNTVILWDINPQSWIQNNCQRVGRNFTHAEWAQYFPGQSYPVNPNDATCPQWPLEPTAAATP